MAVKDKEYTTSIDHFGKPVILKEKQAIATLLTRLLLLEPGSDPLHPDMGVGIMDYRYGITTLDDLKHRVEDQIHQYLPNFTSAKVNLVLMDGNLLNVEIEVDGTLFVYDSTEAPKPISVDDLINDQI